MKISWKRIGLFAGLIALVGVVALGTVAFAQDTDDQTVWPFNLRQKMHEAIAGVLGIGVDEYDAAVGTAQSQLLEEVVAEGVLTQEQADQLLERMEGDFGFRSMPFGRGGMGDRMDDRMGDRMGDRMDGRMGGWMGGPENSLVSVAAEQLNLEVDDLLAELQDGKSIADVAEAQGVNPQTIADAYITTVSESLAVAVAEERITQEQADALLANMKERVTVQLDSGCAGFGFWPRGLQMPEGFQPNFGGRGVRPMPFGDFGPRGSGGRGWMAPDNSGQSTTSTATQL